MVKRNSFTLTVVGISNGSHATQLAEVASVSHQFFKDHYLISWGIIVLQSLFFYFFIFKKSRMSKGESYRKRQLSHQM